MRPGTTVFEWMQDHDVRSIGIDVRRFASFGVIKARIYLFTHATSRLTFGAAGFLTPRTSLADPSCRRRPTTTTHRDQANHHSTTLAGRPQAREYPDGGTDVFVLLAPETAHLGRDAGIRNRKRALDQRHRLAPTPCRRGLTRNTALTCVGRTEQSADRTPP